MDFRGVPTLILTAYLATHKLLSTMHAQEHLVKQCRSFDLSTSEQDAFEFRILAFVEGSEILKLFFEYLTGTGSQSSANYTNLRGNV